MENERVTALLRTFAQTPSRGGTLRLLLGSTLYTILPQVPPRAWALTRSGLPYFDEQRYLFAIDLVVPAVQ